MSLVRITTFSRLHFGLFSFGRQTGRQFGGVGVMVERPGLRLTIQRLAHERSSIQSRSNEPVVSATADQSITTDSKLGATAGLSSSENCGGIPPLSTTGQASSGTLKHPQFGKLIGREVSAEGPLAERSKHFATQVLERMQSDQSATGYHLIVESAPPDHVGLGTGTQLALSIAAGFCRLHGQDVPAAERLAQLAGRGERSAIGTHGFLQGGLLHEAGKLPGESLSPLVSRVEFQADWRFVLIRPDQEQGLSGESEKRAFAALPPVSESISNELCAEAETHLLPAARKNNFDKFAASLGRYSHLAGECFAPSQGGPFAGQHGGRLVELIRSLGFSGVGQSSWGPTLFAVTPDQATAETLVCELHERAGVPLDLTISAVANQGATVELVV